MKSIYVALAMTALVSPALAQNAPAHDPSVHPVIRNFSDLTWEKTNPELGNGSPEVAILNVNPKTKATELLIRTPKDFHVPKHWHSANETLTVIRGTFVVAHEGSEKRVELNVGSYIYMPARMVHEGWTKSEGAMYLVTVDGAWDIIWVN
jgi:quercetin dioxygenase-like cupin family protein